MLTPSRGPPSRLISISHLHSHAPRLATPETRGRHSPDNLSRGVSDLSPASGLVDPLRSTGKVLDLKRSYRRPADWPGSKIHPLIVPDRRDVPASASDPHRIPDLLDRRDIGRVPARHPRGIRQPDHAPSHPAPEQYSSNNLASPPSQPGPVRNLPDHGPPGRIRRTVVNLRRRVRLQQVPAAQGRGSRTRAHTTLATSRCSPT